MEQYIQQHPFTDESEDSEHQHTDIYAGYRQSAGDTVEEDSLGDELLFTIEALESEENVSEQGKVDLRPSLISIFDGVDNLRWAGEADSMFGPGNGEADWQDCQADEAYSIGDETDSEMRRRLNRLQIERAIKEWEEIDGYVRAEAAKHTCPRNWKPFAIFLADKAKIGNQNCYIIQYLLNRAKDNELPEHPKMSTTVLTRMVNRKV